MNCDCFTEEPLEFLKPLQDQDVMESHTAIFETEVSKDNQVGTGVI